MGGKGSGQRPLASWADVDWAMRDIDISQQLGVTREAVRMARRRCGAGPSAPSNMTRFRCYVALNKQALEGRTVDQAIEASGLVGLNRSTAAEALRKVGVPLKLLHGGSATKLGNVVAWELPSLDLARIWGTALSTVVHFRRRHKEAAPRWRASRHRKPSDPEHLAALEAERRRAAELRGASPPG